MQCYCSQGQCTPACNNAWAHCNHNGNCDDGHVGPGPGSINKPIRGDVKATIVHAKDGQAKMGVNPGNNTGNENISPMVDYRHDSFDAIPLFPGLPITGNGGHGISPIQDRINKINLILNERDSYKVKENRVVLREVKNVLHDLLNEGNEDVKPFPNSRIDCWNMIDQWIDTMWECLGCESYNRASNDCSCSWIPSSGNPEDDWWASDGEWCCIYNGSPPDLSGCGGMRHSYNPGKQGAPAPASLSHDNNQSRSGIHNLDNLPQPLQRILKTEVNMSLSGERSGYTHEPTGWGYSQSSNQGFVIFEMISPLGVQSQIAQGTPWPSSFYSAYGYTIYNYKNDNGDLSNQWEWVGGFNHPDSIIGVFYNGECIGHYPYGQNPYMMNALPIMLCSGEGDGACAPEGVRIFELEFKYWDAHTDSIWDLVLSPIGTFGVNYNGNYAYPPNESIGGIWPGVFNYVGENLIYPVAWEPCNTSNSSTNTSCVDPYAFPHPLAADSKPPNYCNGENVIDDWNGSFNNNDILLVEGLSITGPDVVKQDFCTNLGAVPYLDCGYTAPMYNNSPLPNLVSLPIVQGDNSVQIMFGSEGPVHRMITEGEATELTPEHGWIGSLTEIDPFKGYWVYSEGGSPGHNMHIPGQCITSLYDTILYDLHFGANLISYPYHEALTVQEVLSGMEDKITGVVGVSHNGGVATIYLEPPVVTTPGWYGSLTQFEPGRAYWVITNQAFEFDYYPDDFITRRASSTGNRTGYIPLIKKMSELNVTSEESYHRTAIKERKLRTNPSSRFFPIPIYFDMDSNTNINELFENVKNEIINWNPNDHHDLVFECDCPSPYDNGCMSGESQSPGCGSNCGCCTWIQYTTDATGPGYCNCSPCYWIYYECLFWCASGIGHGGRVGAKFQGYGGKTGQSG
tara:strand:- start:554 stop:3280 length:2727 start_codon:yes stop_codon:yes gene_type:complete